MPQVISAAEAARLLAPGMVVYAPGLAGESISLTEAVTAAPDACAGVHFVGVWLPGMNRVDLAALHPDARATAFFVGPERHASFADGRMDYVPLSYLGIWRYLERLPRIDVALLHVSAPDESGCVSFGVANDFTPAVLAKAKMTVAHINPSMPPTKGSATLAWDAIDYVVEEDRPLLGDDGGGDATFERIGRVLAPLVRDGDTLEVGIGRVQSCLAGLVDKRDLALHTGAVTDAVLVLDRAGALAGRAGAITTGVAWGSADLYRFMASDRRVRFAPVGYTHDVRTMAAIDRFVAINTVIEVDLLGQLNAEMIAGRQVSSAGGLTDFMRGARLSAGGFSVVALEAAAKGGTISRIVPELAAGTAVSAARGDVDYVVTEHGIADLRGAGVDARAQALIAVAAPQFRDALKDAWQERRRRM